MKKKVLIISHDKIGTSMAGPGIRYHHMAELLAQNFEVTVGFFDPEYLPDQNFKHSYMTVHIHNTKFEQAFEYVDVVIAMWLSEEMVRFCNRRNVFMVFDIYAPVPVENLTLFLFNGQAPKSDTDYTYKQSFAMFDNFFQNGDLFLFSNRRQLDFWIGYVFGTNQISVSGYTKRPLFDRFIYGPMGIDISQPLEHTNRVIKGKIPGIDRQDKVLLWTGGVWNWFDAQVLIRTMGDLSKSHPHIKLLFLGTKHPNPNIPEMLELTKTRELAKKYNLIGKNVFFKEGWVDYKERINYLLEADVAISTCKPSIEAEFSHRTRILDHILCGLPTIATRGDYFTDEIIVPNNLGIAVPPNDVGALTNAILDSLDKITYKSMKRSIAKIRPIFDWSSTLAELNEIILKDAPKLPLVKQIQKNRRGGDNSMIRFGKKVTPKYIKRLYIRMFKYGQ